MSEKSSPTQYRHLISEGFCEPLSTVLFHQDGPFQRRKMAGSNLHPSADLHVAVHEVRNAPFDLERRYCQVHAHNCFELNLLLSFERMVFRITLGEEVYLQEAPASILIPAGLPHSANVVEGVGFFIVILGRRDYLQTLIGGKQE